MNRQKFGLSIGLKNRLIFHFDSETYYTILNIFLVWGISSQNSSDFSSQNFSIELVPSLRKRRPLSETETNRKVQYRSCSLGGEVSIGTRRSMDDIDGEEMMEEFKKGIITEVWRL